MDYLGKYCIISAEQMRQYRIVFNNVDRDKDGLVTITEMDFGIKTINRQLLTNQQGEYINEILEVDPSQALNFRFFAVIAAV